MDGRRLALVAALLAAPATGCVGSDPTGGPADATAGAEDPALDASPADPAGSNGSARVEELNLSVGDRFQHRVQWDDGAALTYDAIAVEERPDAWLLATSNRTAAIRAAQAGPDWPTLGPLAKPGLAPTGEGGFPGFYGLPLEDGSTWTRTVEIGGDAYELTFQARREADADTPLGSRDRYLVEARTSNDTLVYRYDLVPGVGWFSELAFFEPGEASLEERLAYRVRAEARETGWTGSYYVNEATQVLGHASWLAALGLPDPGAANPDPAARFEVGGDATYVSGFLGAFAAAGAQATQLVDPDGNARRHVAAGGPDGDVSSERVLADAVPGTWSVETAGAGGASGGWAFLWTVTERTRTLG